MGNRRNHFVAEPVDASPVNFVCLVDVGVTVAGWHVRETESFIADPKDVADLEGKGFIVRRELAGEMTYHPEPDPELVINTESTE